MESCVRHLRDGSAESGQCSVGVLIDDAHTIGAREIQQQMCSNYLQALDQQRTQARRVVNVSLEGRVKLPSEHQACTLVDGFTDPGGWLRDANQLNTDAGPANTNNMLHSLHVAGGLEELQQAVLQQVHTGSGKACVIIDSLSPVLLHHSYLQVLRTLQHLASDTDISAIITCVHKDVHPPHVIAGVERIATCVARLRQVSGLQQEALAHSLGVTPHGCIDFEFKARRAGRMRVESQFYRLMSNGSVDLFVPPAHLESLMSPEALVALSLGPKGQAAAAAAASSATASIGVAAAVTTTQADGAVGAGTSATDDVAVKMAGGMRLTLTPEEQQARQAVVLPYEHQGQGSAYHTGDWKDYLPAAAGGKAGQQHVTQAAVPGALGQIIYTRDSDEEDGGLHDSDEDPDDDLDI